MFTPSLQDIVRNMREAEQAKQVPETPVVPTGVLRPVEYLEVTADLMLPVLKALVQGQPLSTLVAGVPEGRLQRSAKEAMGAGADPGAYMVHGHGDLSKLRWCLSLSWRL